MASAGASRLWYLAATFMFAAAVFRIADGSMLLGVIFFAAASCFTSLGGLCGRAESDKKHDNADEVR